MAVKLGYGGIANTNGARDFTGKAAAAAEVVQAGTGARRWRNFSYVFLILLGRF